jgi:hypothetical protein
MNLITSQRKPHQMEGRRSITLSNACSVLEILISYEDLIANRVEKVGKEKALDEIRRQIIVDIYNTGENISDSKSNNRLDVLSKKAARIVEENWALLPQ